MEEQKLWKNTKDRRTTTFKSNKVGKKHEWENGKDGKKAKNGRAARLEEQQCLKNSQD